MANYVLDYSGSQINTRLGNATTTSPGVMSAEDKIKLNGIEDEANKTLIDDTLTEEGQAADAKATGDAILDLSLITTEERTVTGSIVTLENCPDKIPLKSCIVGIEPMQDLHGYDNPWPAGGGKNLCELGEVIVTSGYATKNLNNKIPVGAYVFSAVVTSSDTDSDKCLISFDDSQGTRVTSGLISRSTGRTSVFINLTADVYRIIFYSSTSASTSSGDSASFADIQIELGSTATSYVPYSNICPISGWTGCNISHSGADTSDPTVIPISWQSEVGTVYGGTLDVIAGEMTVEYVAAQVKDFNFTITEPCVGGTAFCTPETPNKFPYNYGNLTSAYSDMLNFHYVPSSWSVYSMEAYEFTVKGSRLVVSGPFNDATAMKVAVGDAVIVFKTTSPQTYQLTPTEVTTILGQNNIWADCGDVSVTNGGYLTRVIEHIDSLEESLGFYYDKDV